MRTLTSICASLALCAAPLAAAEPLVGPGDVIALCGDALTQSGIWTGLVEQYLRVCRPDRQVAVVQCGWDWGGVGAAQFAGHMSRDILTIPPTVVGTWFGMFEGGFLPPDPAKEKSHREGLGRIIDGCRNARVRLVIASPAAVDPVYFKSPWGQKTSGTEYNRTLGNFAAIDKELATAAGVPFADVHATMLATITAAKARLGNAYRLNDGVSATPQGHLAAAYAFLKALGFDGDLATFTVDAAAGTATASEGHRIVSAIAGDVVVESSRYPFCFAPGNVAEVLPSLPFNQDLNRWRLVVKNLKTAQARITWGTQSLEFTAAQLAGGINLAGEFLDNPFVTPFNEVAAAVQRKQAFETSFIKDFLCEQRQPLSQSLGGDAASLKALEAGFRAAHAAMSERCVQAMQPVTHSIRIDALP